MKESLRTIFQSPFDIKQWNKLLQNLFKATELRLVPENFENNPTEEGYYLGNIQTSDSYRIGLFHYNIKQGSVANKRVGLRKLVKTFINPQWGEFDAALVVFNEIQSPSPNPVPEKYWRLSFICDIKDEATAPKRYTYVFGNKELLYKTPIDRFIFLKDKGISFENLKKAFSVEALSDEFFDKYREQYANFIQYITGKRFVKSGSKWEEKNVATPNYKFMQAFGNDEKKIRDYIKKMMGRITFLHFLQRKGWMCGDLNYMQNLFQRSSHQDDYLDAVLEPLFFGILNTKPEQREALFEKYSWDKSLLAEWSDIPYLNGGLFERDENDEPESKFPAEYFERLFNFFSEYNFTIDENDPNDAEVGVDPEMLGKIFENLLEDNKDKGAFYTPKEIVRYMCQESLIAYLETNTSIAKEKIRNFVLSPEEGIADISEKWRCSLIKALENVKICDPAIGSGAFPMGLLNELLKCREALVETSPLWRLNESEKPKYNRAEIKKSIIQNNIYGVDIEKGAVDIARLRFWLSIVVDDEEASPLPNLDYKIMQGNSLIESYKGLDLSKLTYAKKSGGPISQYSIFEDDTKQLQREVTQLLTQYYSCSDHDKKTDLRNKISNTIAKQLSVQNFDADILRELRTLDLAGNDKFFLWHTWFSDVFNKGGFDIVIGNPPYVKEYTNRKAFDGFREVSPYYMGKMDLWYGFACHGIDLLKQEGTLCFIAQNNWTTSAGAKKMRNKVISDSQILQLLDFNTYMVFENAEIQTMVMLFKRNRDVDDYEFDYRIITQCNEKEDMLALLAKQIRNTKYITPEISRKSLIDKSITFSNNNNILEKITNNKTYLQIKEIGQGIVPALDNYFILSDISNYNEKEKQYIKPYFTGLKDRYVSYPLDKYLIYMSAKNFVFTNLDNYPNIKLHFEPHKEELLLAKIKYGTPNKPYYFVHRERDENFFKEGNEKIISQIRCRRPTFHYTTNAFYGSRALFFIRSKRWNMKFLVGILNSSLVAYWIQNKGKKQGELYKLDKEPLLEIPLPILDDTKQQPIINLVEQILILKEVNPQADTSILEKEIDTVVYNLYGLTEEEIRVVEGK